MNLWHTEIIVNSSTSHMIYIFYLFFKIKEKFTWIRTLGLLLIQKYLNDISMEIIIIIIINM